MFPAFWVKFVSFGNVRVFPVFRVELVDHLLRDDLILFPRHCRNGFAGGLYLVLVDFLRCVCGLQECENVLDVAVRGRDEDLLQIFDDLVFPPFADLANLAVHEGRPHLVAALLADFTPEGHVMID